VVSRLVSDPAVAARWYSRQRPAWTMISVVTSSTSRVFGSWHRFYLPTRVPDRLGSFTTDSSALKGPEGPTVGGNGWDLLVFPPNRTPVGGGSEGTVVDPARGMRAGPVAHWTRG
jgi:hypothetical protein